MPKSSPKNASIPKTGQPSTAAQRIRSFVRNTLLASPEFPRLYADVVISSAPNSNEAKILVHNYKKIVERVNMNRTNLKRTKGTNMPTRHTVKDCTHIKVTGVRCGSPSLRGEQFCYFHQRMLRTVKSPDSRIHHVALLENEEAIQASLMEVVNGLIRGTIELKRGELILRALNTAVRNIRRVHFDLHQEDMVREMPSYPAAPITEVDEAAAAEADRVATRAEIARVAAAHLAAPQIPTNYLGTAHVGTAAPGCPSGPEVPGRSAVALKPASTEPAVFMERKPPQGVKPEAVKAAAPKERKIAAHRVSGGRKGGR